MVQFGLNGETRTRTRKTQGQGQTKSLEAREQALSRLKNQKITP